MAVQFLKVGDSLDYTAGADIAKGDLVIMGNTVGIALDDIANGAVGPVAVEGVFSGVAKVSSAVFVAGEKLLLDVSGDGGAGAFDDSAATPANGDIMGAAIAAVDGANLETTCTIKLTPGNTEITVI